MPMRKRHDNVYTRTHWDLYPDIVTLLLLLWLGFLVFSVHEGWMDEARRRRAAEAVLAPLGPAELTPVPELLIVPNVAPLVIEPPPLPPRRAEKRITPVFSRESQTMAGH